MSIWLGWINLGRASASTCLPERRNTVPSRARTKEDEKHGFAFPPRKSCTVLRFGTHSHASDTHTTPFLITARPPPLLE